MTCYDVLVTFDRVLTSALVDFLAIFESTASVLPSALSESTSCVRTVYKEDTKRISDVAFDEFGRVCRHGRIRTNLGKSGACANSVYQALLSAHAFNLRAWVRGYIEPCIHQYWHFNTPPIVSSVNTLLTVPASLVVTHMYVPLSS